MNMLSSGFNPKYPFVKGANFQPEYDKFIEDKTGKAFIEHFREQKLPVKFTHQTYRTISTWVKYGLIDDPRDNNIGWRKYSLLDLMWVRIIDELRLFGLPLEKIKEVKDWLFLAPVEGKTWYFVDFFSASALCGRPVALAVLSDGTAHLGMDEEIRLSQKHAGLNHFIYLNFSEIIKEVFKFPELRTDYERLWGLSKAELELLHLIKTNNYSSIEVVMGRSAIQRIEASQDVEPETRIIDLIKENKFQEINVKQKDGKIVSIKRTILTKPE